MRIFVILLIIHPFLFVPKAYAKFADVINVKVQCQQTCTFTVTVRHADKGWRHYANRFEVLSLKGDIIATRILGHPHVHEQPFTRALTGVHIPEDMEEVIIRAHDSVHGYGGNEIQVRIKDGQIIKGLAGPP